MMGGGPGGGGGMGMGPGPRGGGPGGMGLNNLADEDGAVYDPKIARRALAYLAPFKLDTLFVVVMTVASAALMTIGPVLTKIAIDNHIAVNDMVGMSIFLGLTIVAYTGAFLTNWAQFNVMTRVGQQMLQKMRGDMFRHIQKLPLTYFDKIPSGVVVSEYFLPRKW